MNADRFDALAHFMGSRTSRRVAVAVAATGLLTIAVPEAEALRCSRTSPARNVSGAGDADAGGM